MTKYIIRFQEKTAATARLFCVPFAGSTVAYYRPWGTLLPPEIELCAIEIPGRLYTNDKSPEDMKGLVDVLYSQLLEYLDKPFAIFGHSFGSIIAYEIVKRLQKENKQLPVGLYVSSRRAPQLPTRFRSTLDLSDSEFITEMQSKYHAIPQAFLKEKELLKLLLPILREDIRINETYMGQLDPLLDVPVTAYYGKEDNAIHLDEMQKWKAVTSKKFHLEVFEGGHFFIDKEQGKIVSEIIDALSQ